jgi:cellulose biosynthesis protein BcsQ
MRAVASVANVAARSGKTTVAVNHAAGLAGRGVRTPLVDADPRARATLLNVLFPATPRTTERQTAAWDVFSPPGFTPLGVIAGGSGRAR